MIGAGAKKTALQCCELLDMHCHLGFCEDAAQAARELADAGVGAFSNTVTPAEFAEQQAALAGADNVRVGVGLHPWWVGEGDGAPSPEALRSTSAMGADQASVAGAADAAQGASLPESLSCEDLLAGMEGTRFVGEVGLDFSSAHAATREAQVDVLAQVARACAQAGGKVVSLHAVRAVDDVLDVLERAGALAADAGNSCIIHWFSGTSDQLTRARRLGCFFSVNPRMLQSKRGRAYAQAIPADRLLIETDLPTQVGAPWDAAHVRQLLERTVRDLAELRREDVTELQERIAATSHTLLA